MTDSEGQKLNLAFIRKVIKHIFVTKTACVSQLSLFLLINVLTNKFVFFKVWPLVCFVKHFD